MPHSAALRPFGFSQPTRVTTKAERRSDTPVPRHDPDLPFHPETPHRSSRSHRRSISNDTFGPYRTPPSPSQPRIAASRSGTQRTFPDEEEDEPIQQPARRSRTSEKRHLPRLQTSRHAQNPSLVSPLTHTATNKLANMQLRSPSEMPTIREAFSQKQLQEQIKEVYSALRRVEDEREKVLNHMKAGRADQCRVERELEETRRENQRLTRLLEEMLRSSKMTSPLSPRNDDGCWGCSMYDMEGEGC